MSRRNKIDALVPVIRALLSEGKSEREVAELAGISRATVSAIASGRRRDPADDPPARPTQGYGRCEGCGHVVPLPCLYCEVRTIEAEPEPEQYYRITSKRPSRSLLLKSFICLAISLLAAMAIAAEPTPAKQNPLFHFGTPERPQIVRPHFCLAFDGAKRHARWVMQHFTAADLRGPAVRHSSFLSDAAIPAEFRPASDDYTNSGLVRGHLAAAADFRGAEVADAFRVTNIVPMDAKLNSGDWSRLEAFCRSRAEGEAAVWIVTIPLYLPTNRVVAYRVIGDVGVAVPTHVGKSLLVAAGDSIELFAWLAPNVPPRDGETFAAFQVSVDQLEASAGLPLWESLEDERERTLEAR